MQENPNAPSPYDNIGYNTRFSPPIINEDDILLKSPLYLYMLNTETQDFDYNYFKYLLRTFPQYIKTMYPKNKLTIRKILNKDDSSIIHLAIEKGNAKAFGMLFMSGVGDPDNIVPHNRQNVQELINMITEQPYPLQTKMQMLNFIKKYKSKYGKNSQIPGGGSRIRRSKKSRKNHKTRKLKN